MTDSEFALVLFDSTLVVLLELCDLVSFDLLSSLQLIHFLKTDPHSVVLVFLY